MSIETSLTFSDLRRLNKNCATLGNIDQHQLLWRIGRRFVRVLAPDQTLRNADNMLGRVVHQITSFALKVILAIGRLIGEQDDESNLFDLEQHVQRLVWAVNQPLPEALQCEPYRALELLNQIAKSLTVARDVGLVHLYETYRSGCTYLFPDAETVREDRGARVQQVIGQIDEQILPELCEKIQQLEEYTLEQDQAYVRGIITRLVERESLEEPGLLEQTVTVRAFEEEAMARYGEAPVRRALDYYQLAGRKTLTGREVAALLVGTVANLTWDDLEAIYQQQASSSNRASLDQLSDEEVFALLSRVRDIHYQAVAVDKKLPYSAQLQQDKDLLFVMGDIDEFRSDIEPDCLAVRSLRRYGHAEFLTRHLSYALHFSSQTQFPDGLLFGMYDKNNRLTLRRASNVISERGLHAAAIRPARSQPSLQPGLHPGQQKVRVQLLFRGTYCTDSLFRDVSLRDRTRNHIYDGPGKLSFERRQDVITERLQDEVRKALAGSEEDTVLLEVLGHSLGGSDAQRAVEYLSYRLRGEDHRFSGINLYAFNSPNVETAIARRFIDSVEQLEIPFKLRYFDVHHDMIQETGAKRLGWCGSRRSRPANLGVSIFKFNRNVLERIVALSRHVFYRMQYLLTHSLAVHRSYCLRLHQYQQPDQYNETFIQDIHTDMGSDAGLLYGEDLSQVADRADPDEIDDFLVTSLARFGRRVDRRINRMLDIATWGRWSARTS